MRLTRLDGSLIRDCFAFFAHAPRRHPWAAAAAFSWVFGLSALVLPVLPKTWAVEAQLYLDPNTSLAALAGLGDWVRRRAEVREPTTVALERVLQPLNVVALCEKTALLDGFLAARSPLVQLKDRLLTRIRGSSPKREDLSTALAEVVLDKVEVTVKGPTLNFEMKWVEPEGALRFIQALQASFLEAREQVEIEALLAALDVLRERKSRLAVLESGLKGLKRERLAVPASSQRTPSADVALLKARQEGVRALIDDIEAQRRGQAEALRYAVQHVEGSAAEIADKMRELRSRLEQLEQPSPSLRALSQQESQLSQALDELGGSEEAAWATVSDDISPAQKLRAIEVKSLLLASRLEDLEFDRNLLHVAFAKRVVVLAPAALPKRPLKPNLLEVLLCGALAGVLLSLLAAVLIDLQSGLLVEPWQIQRELDLPVLQVLSKP